MIPVDIGIPIPGCNYRYPWTEMNVGDSFFVSGAKIKNISVQAVSAGRRHGIKFSCRTVDGGIRVWRVA